MRDSERLLHSLDKVLGARIRLQLLGGLVMIGLLLKVDDNFAVLTKVKVFTSGLVTLQVPHITVNLSTVTSWSIPVADAIIKPFDGEVIKPIGLQNYKLYTLISVNNHIEHYDASQVPNYSYAISTVRSGLPPEAIQLDYNNDTDDCDERELRRMAADCDLRQKEREILASRPPKLTMRPVRQAVSLGVQVIFWVPNSLNSQIQITATCVKISVHANIFIQDSIDRKALTDEVVNDYADVWDNNIYPKVRQTFGNDRDTDDDSKLYILFTKELNDFGAAGQFRADDKHPESFVFPVFSRHSNEKDMFYVEIPDADDKEYDKGTLAHEFQHMVNFDARNDQYQYAESTWLNEAFSGLAEFVTGFGEQSWNNMRSFLAGPISLTCWTTLNRRNYGGSYLFGRYLFEQYGAMVIKKIVQNIGYYGLFNVENVTNVDFNITFNNWVTALCLSNTGYSDEAKYNFSTLDLRANGFDGLRTYASFDIGISVSCVFKPYFPLKIELTNHTSNSTLAVTGDSPGGEVIAALKPI